MPQVSLNEAEARDVQLLKTMDATKEFVEQFKADAATMQLQCAEVSIRNR